MLSAMLSSDRLSALHFHTLNQIKGLRAARLLDYGWYMCDSFWFGQIMGWLWFDKTGCLSWGGSLELTNSLEMRPTHYHPPLEKLFTKKTTHTHMHAHMNPYKHTGEAESLFHWSMTAKPPSGTPRSPWQPQRFSGHEDVVNKSGESSPKSGRSQACAKWSVFPVNLLFLNPVKLKTLPKSHPQTSHIMQNSKTIMHQCLRVM